MFGKKKEEPESTSYSPSPLCGEPDPNEALRIEMAQLQKANTHLEARVTAMESYHRGVDFRLGSHGAEISRTQNIVTMFMLKLGWEHKRVEEQVIPAHDEIAKVVKA